MHQNQSIDVNREITTTQIKQELHENRNKVVDNITGVTPNKKKVKSTKRTLASMIADIRKKIKEL